MIAVGSSKVISNRELFYLVFLFQQGGLFWLLPYFLVRENGTIGLTAMLGGLGAALAILCVCSYWGTHMPERGFITALKEQQAILGSVVGGLLVAVYLLYGVLSLYSLIDVLQKQLLPKTPSVVLCASLLLLVGWMSWRGLETIARLTMLCFGALLLQIVLSVAGTAELFSIIHTMPFQVKQVTLLEEATVHSVYCYSGLLVLFMLYPSCKTQKTSAKQVGMAVVLGAVLLVAWTWYALGVFGQYSLQTILWIPAHLARMVQISALFEQTESLFVVLWMTLVLTSAGLTVWSASEGLHQLFGRKKSIGVHSFLVLTMFAILSTLHNTIQFLQMEYRLAQATLVVLPLLLLTILFLTARKERRL